MSAEETYVAALKALFAAERVLDKLASTKLLIEEEIAVKTMEKAKLSNEAQAAFETWRLVETATGGEVHASIR